MERDPDSPAEILKRKADRVTSLILFSDAPREWISREMVAVRAYCMRELPDRLDLFERIYASRWERLWREFRRPSGGDAG
jgi:hypothetical protein